MDRLHVCDYLYTSRFFPFSRSESLLWSKTVLNSLLRVLGGRKTGSIERSRNEAYVSGRKLSDLSSESLFFEFLFLRLLRRFFRTFLGLLIVEDSDQPCFRDNSNGNAHFASSDSDFVASCTSWLQKMKSVDTRSEHKLTSAVGLVSVSKSSARTTRSSANVPIPRARAISKPDWHSPTRNQTGCLKTWLVVPQTRPIRLDFERVHLKLKIACPGVLSAGWRRLGDFHPVFFYFGRPLPWKPWFWPAAGEKQYFSSKERFFLWFQWFYDKIFLKSMKKIVTMKNVLAETKN